MPRIAETERLIGNIRRLRRAERDPGGALGEITAVRADLERGLERTMSPARAAHLLGVSRPALDRWVRAGAVPVVITPTGRREVPSSVVLDLLEQLDRLGAVKQPLAKLLRGRRERAQSLAARRAAGGRVPSGHSDAERHGLAYLGAVADRLDPPMVDRARTRLERLRDEGRIHQQHYDAWRRILDLPLDGIKARLRADDERARALRQSAPFAGELDELERRELIETGG